MPFIIHLKIIKIGDETLKTDIYQKIYNLSGSLLPG